MGRRSILRPRWPLIVALGPAVALAAPRWHRPADAGDHEFGGDPAAPHYPRHRTYDLHDVELDIDVDPVKRHIVGHVVETLAPLADGLASVHLDAVELDVHAAHLVGGPPLAFAENRDGLDITLPRAYHAGEVLTIAVDYDASPRRGMYFTQWPGQPPMAWTQGEQELNRYWLPIWDSPDDKATSEIQVTCDRALTAVSNGELVAVTEDRSHGTHTFDWVERVPHSTYLDSIVVGRLARVDDRAGDVPLSYYVEPGREADARRTYGRTPEMIALFAALTGRAFPYEKYAQTTVPGFMWGGMENISATTLTDTDMVTPRVAGSLDVGGLVAHELAHQWFGDLLTTKDWANVWLNEGFATFFELLWQEQGRSEDEYAAARAAEMRWYLEEDASDYSRPVVDRVYASTEKLFDAHTYAKGALVLHMLRVYLGDARFFAGIRAYVAAYAGKNVETSDFARAMSDAVGEDLSWFFDQWIFRAGHPSLAIRWRYDDASREVTLDVTQAQSAGDPEATPPYVLPTRVEVWLDGTHAFSFPVRLSRRDEELLFSAPSRPRAVLVDPAHDLVAPQTDDRSAAEDEFLLASHPGSWVREDAAQALASLGGTSDAIAALATCLARDRFHAVREACAAALGDLRTSPSLDVLLTAVHDGDARVRLAVVRALGSFRFSEDPRAAATLAAAAQDDSDDQVRGAALTALGATRAPSALAALSAALDRTGTWDDKLPTGALAGLAALDDGAATIPIVLARTGPEVSYRIRAAALEALGEIDASLDTPRDDLRDTLRLAARDADFIVREAAVTALGATGDTKALPILGDIEEREPEERIQLLAEDGEKSLRDAEAGNTSLGTAIRDLSELREDERRLRERLETLPNATKPVRRGDAASAPLH